ncbi:MAG: phage tail protein [Methylohalobius sp. ZOD2]|nr:phage tail protein [Methylothermaceae bacterium]
MSEPFIAEIRMMPYVFAPRDWARCDGQPLAIAQFQTLFAVIGTIYGGNGRTTFNLPDLSGRTPMHWGQGPGLSSRNIGETVGTSTVTLTEYEMPAHNHAANADASQGGEATPANNFIAQGKKPGGRGRTVDVELFSSDIGNAVAMAQQSISPTGGSQPHDNRQLYLAIPFCIALEGIFPSRN